MKMSKPATPRFRWNSIFVKLAALIYASAVILTAITSYTYTRAQMRQIKMEIAHSAINMSELLESSLSAAVLARAPVPIALQLGVLTRDDNQATRHGIAVDASGRIIASRGRADEDEAALVALAQAAMSADERRTSSDGLMVADPVRNARSGEVGGAIATSWSSDFAMAQALEAQVPVIVVASITTLVGVLGLVALIRRWITRPMNRIASDVDRMAGDDLGVDIDTRARGDEIGDIGKSLETLRQRLATGREEARENRFRGTAFASSSAAIMMVDSSLRIAAMNQTVHDILRYYVEDFRRITPSFDPEKVIGQSIDTFHAPGLRERVRTLLMDPARLPYKADIAVGDARFILTITRVQDVSGQLEGFVVEWNDTTAEFMKTAVLDAIEVNQAKAEFGLDGSLLHANALFARAIGTSPEDLAGETSRSIFAFDQTLSVERGDVFDRLVAGDPVYGSFHVKRRDGDMAIIDGSFTPVHDTAGRLLRIILIGTDVTAAKRTLEIAEAERAELLATQARVVDVLRSGLERLAEGDLTGRINDAFPGEYDQLRSDFNLAVNRLQDAMRGVIDNAGLIQGEAAEISSAADDLSARTERQAATLEQTAAALDELTSSVTSAADGAAHANSLVETAHENAEASGEVVRQAVEAMGEIESSSQQISKITGVIDDIAFQTNLLALNAGVEAARAGEAGRGFAVVASEVRALAQRSSDAAREINALISASGIQVNRGVALVDRAGEVLKGIVESVKEISRNVNEIAVSSREQSSGLGEINAAVNQLDQVTQQNAAMFEQTTAASHALTREAEALTRTMGRFRIGEPPQGRANVVTATFASQSGGVGVETAAPKAWPAAVSGAATLPKPEVDEDDGWDEF